MKIPPQPKAEARTSNLETHSIRSFGCRISAIGFLAAILCIQVLAVAEAANDYNIKLLVGTNVIGDAEQISLPSGSSVTITDFPNGVRQAIVMSLAGVGGGGSGTNDTLNATNCIQIVDLGGGTNLAIGVDTNCLVNEFSNLTNAFAGAGVTNGLATIALVNALSNFFANAGYVTVSVTNGLATTNQLTSTSNTLNNTMISTAGVLQAQITGLGSGTNPPTAAGFGLTAATVAGTNTLSVNAAVIAALASNNTFTGSVTFNGGMVVIDNGGLSLGAGAPFSVNNAGATFTTMTVNNDATFNYFAWFQTNVWDNGATVISNNATVTGTFTAPGFSANANGTNTLTGVWVSDASLVGSGFGPALTNGLVGTLTSSSPQFATFSASGNNGLVTLTLNSGILTNGLTGSLWDNAATVFSNNVTVTAPLLDTSTATISNNATVTGTLFVGGAISAPGGFAGITTGSVASVNGLVSNVVITATGHATATTTPSATGGTITISDPTQFVATNTSTSLQPAPLFWDTKYGALRVSNNFGATFINLPDLSTTSNENVALTDYFVNTSTSAWTVVNATNMWTFVDSNNWAWVQSNGINPPSIGTYYLKAIPTTNQSWRCRVLVQPMVGQTGTFSMNAGFGVVAAENSNTNLRAFTMWRGSSATPELRAFVSATAATTYSAADTFDLSTEAQWWGNSSSALEVGPASPVWMQISYDGSTILKYTYCVSVNGLPPPIVQNGQYSFIKTNQTVNPQYVGMAVLDSTGSKLTFAIKAFVFEQP